MLICLAFKKFYSFQISGCRYLSTIYLWIIVKILVENWFKKFKLPLLKVVVERIE